MKNYKDMADAVFRRRDEYAAAMKKKKRIAMSTGLSLCAVFVAVIGGVSLWQSGILSGRTSIDVKPLPTASASASQTDTTINTTLNNHGESSEVTASTSKENLLNDQKPDSNNIAPTTDPAESNPHPSTQPTTGESGSDIFIPTETNPPTNDAATPPYENVPQFTVPDFTVPTRTDPVEPTTALPTQPTEINPFPTEPMAPVQPQPTEPMAPSWTDKEEGTIYVKTKTISGVPVAGVYFKVYSSEGEYLTTVYTGSSGECEIKVPVGKYILEPVQIPEGFTGAPSKVTPTISKGGSKATVTIIMKKQQQNKFPSKT